MKKSIVAALLLTTVVLSESAQASPTWSISTQGVISSGYDYAGLFGIVGRDLAGLQYTQTIIGSYDPADYETVQTFPHYIDIYGKTSSLLKDVVTVGGFTKEFNISSNGTVWFEIANALSSPGINGDDAIYASISGDDSDAGMYVSAENSIFTTNPDFAFVPTLDFAQKISAKTDSSESFTFAHLTVRMNGADALRFDAKPGWVTVNGDVDPTSVPEPASIALFGLGLFGMGIKRRKHKA